MLVTIFDSKADTLLGSYIGTALAPFNIANVDAQIPNFIAAFTSGETAVLSQIPGVTPAVIAAAQTAYKWAYYEAFKVAYCATIPFGVFAIVAACFIRDPSKYFTGHVAVHLEKEVVGKQKRQSHPDEKVEDAI